MSRWIMMAGLAAILISLVALAVLSAGSGPPATGGASQGANAPQAPGQSTGPTETPATTPAPATTPGTTAPEATVPEQAGQSGRSQGGGGNVQRIRPGDQGAAGTGPRVATIEVSGDARYSCSIGLIDSPRTVRGTGPDAYQVRVAPGGSSLDAVMASCQKISGEELGVGIIYNSEVRAQDDTTEQFGTVSVTWSPIQVR